MLYDKRWDKQVDVHSLDTLTSWLAQKNPTEVYHYEQPYECALAQYFQAHGRRHNGVTHNSYWTLNMQRVDLPPGFYVIAHGWRGGTQTFGAAYARARRRQTWRKIAAWCREQINKRRLSSWYIPMVFATPS